MRDARDDGVIVVDGRRRMTLEVTLSTAGGGAEGSGSGSGWANVLWSRPQSRGSRVDANSVREPFVALVEAGAREMRPPDSTVDKLLLQTMRRPVQDGPAGE